MFRGYIAILDSMQKIKITIGDRVYPLSVTEGQEAFLRNSAKQIDQMMKHKLVYNRVAFECLNQNV